MLIHYDLAKVLVERRQVWALAEFQRRDRGAEPPLVERCDAEADVIELVFAGHCESGQIGA